MLSGRLERYKIKSNRPYQINFRCPICGDSQKSKRKTRAWLFEDSKSDKFRFHCFNCNANVNGLGGLLKIIDPRLYNEYVTDKYLNRARITERPKDALAEATFKKPVFANKTSVAGLTRVTELKPDHPVVDYITKRQIPTEQWHRLWYTPKFNAWVNSKLPGKLEDSLPEEPRLVMPFFDETGELFGVSGRSFNPKSLRYMTIMFDEEHPKIFGLDKVDFNRRYYVVEGALDSLFLENSVAMAGADGNATALKQTENAVFVFDNERRNKEIHGQLEKIIRRGYKLCIWPTTVKQKDLNDMVLGGLTDLKQIIDDNIYSGLDATLKLTEWRRT